MNRTHSPGPAASLAAALFLTAGLAAWADAATQTLVVEAGQHARAHVPMNIALPEGVAKARLTCDGKDVPCQVAEGKLWWILDRLAAGAAKTYAVDLGADGAGDPKAVDFRETPETVEIAIDRQPFTAYCFSNPKTWGQQLRRPYFYPIFGPDQTLMTRPYPLVEELPKTVSRDHPHHTSLWVAYGEVGGTDNWSIADKAGWQLHKGFAVVASGAVVGYFRETLDWTTSDKKPALAETRTVRIYRLPAAARLIDLEIAFHAKYGKVVFGDTKEAGLCSTRMRDELRADKEGKEGRLVNAQGLTGEDAWGKRSQWCDGSGLVGGQRIGYAVFDAPNNPNSPVRWHARTYGLIATNPFSNASFEKGAAKTDTTLEAGKDLTFRYRLYFHPGDEKEGQVAAKFADYADPPKAAFK